MKHAEFAGRMPKVSGLYSVTNLVNGKVYIGQSNDIFLRWKAHIRKSLFVVGSSIAKHGVQNFEFCILVVTHKGAYLDELEKNAIAAFDSLSPKGYNLDIGAGLNPFASEESRLRHLAAVQSEANRAKISESMKLVCADVEFLEARSKSVKEALNRPETLAKQSMSSKKMWESEEYRKKHAEAMRPILDSDEYKALISETSKIHRNTPEAKQRTSELSKAKWADPVHRIKVCFSRFPSKSTPTFEVGWQRCLKKGVPSDYEEFARDFCVTRTKKANTSGQTNKTP
jgi:group I intron endonuclease